MKKHEKKQEIRRDNQETKKIHEQKIVREKKNEWRDRKKEKK